MSTLHGLPESASDDPVFRRAPLIGFLVGATFAPFVLTRPDARPVDWQGGIKLPYDDVPGSGRRLYQDLGPTPLTLETNLLFQTEDAFQTFWALIRAQGTLRMNRAWTRRVPDRVTHQLGVDYAEFDDVTVVSPGVETFDRRGAVMLEGVVFEREDTATWS